MNNNNYHWVILVAVSFIGIAWGCLLAKLGDINGGILMGLFCGCWAGWGIGNLIYENK